MLKLLVDPLLGQGLLQLPVVLLLADALLELLGIAPLAEALLGLFCGQGLLQLPVVLLLTDALLTDALLGLMCIPQGRGSLLGLLGESLYILHGHDLLS